MRAAEGKRSRIDRHGSRKLPSRAIAGVAALFAVLALASGLLETNRTTRQVAQLEYVRGSVLLRSPIDGQIGQLPVHVGALILKGEEAVTVVASRRIRDRSPDLAFIDGRAAVERSYKALEDGIRAQYRRKASLLSAELEASRSEHALLESELVAVADSLRSTEAIVNDYQRMVGEQLLPRIEAHRIQNELASKRANQDQLKRALVAASTKAQVLQEEIRLGEVELALDLERLAAQKRSELGTLYGDEAGYFGSMLSPVNAVVSEVLVAHGESVSKNQPLVHLLTKDAALGFRASLDARSAAWTRAGDEIPVRLYTEQGGESVRGVARVESKTPVNGMENGDGEKPELVRYELVLVLKGLDSDRFVPAQGIRAEAELPAGKETFLDKLLAPFGKSAGAT